MKIVFAILIFNIVALNIFTHSNSVNAAEIEQFEVFAGGIQTMTLNLQNGDFVKGSVSVTGGSNDVNFWVTDPSGNFIVRKQGIIDGTDFEFKSERDGAHTLHFDNSFSIVTSKLVTLTYEIEKSIGGCLIATATFGSELTPQVQFLREIRDSTVLSTASGTSFMTAFNAFYYSFSPTVADLERQNPMFKEMVKVAIIPLLSSLSLLQYVDIDSEVEMLGYGIGIILLNIGMYFVAPALIFVKIKHKLS